MDVNELDYPFDPELIASRPLARRDGARLMVLHRDNGVIEHKQVQALPSLLKEPCLWVVNDTRVFKARLFGHRRDSGAKVELLLVEPVETSEDAPGGAGTRPSSWLALGKTKRGFQPGTEIVLTGSGFEGETAAPEAGSSTSVAAWVDQRRDDGLLVLRFDVDDVMTMAEELGSLPLPPYLKRAADASDEQRYQTVFAKNLGAVAAPTAGLHLSKDLIADLEARGHRFASLTLHVGPGTFQPVRSKTLREHVMHEEHYVIPPSTERAILDAKRRGMPLLAVGTTVVRALEAAAAASTNSTTARRRDPDQPTMLQAQAGSTDLLIYPPYRFRLVDALLTNFHLPRSTLIALVMAFAGVTLTREAYRLAVKERYRFYSYGDAMLVTGTAPRTRKEEGP